MIGEHVTTKHEPGCTTLAFPDPGAHEGACVTCEPNEEPCPFCHGVGEVERGGADAESDPPLVLQCLTCKGARKIRRRIAKIPPLRSIGDILEHVKPPALAGRDLEFGDAPLERVRADEAPRDLSDPAFDAPEFVALPFIPAKHRDSRFDTFDTARAGPEFVRDLATAKRAVERWVTAAIEGRPAMLAIVGATGNGKSHLLYAAAHAIEAARRDVWCLAWYKLADSLRYGGVLPWALRDERERGRKLNVARLEGWQLRERMHASPIVMIDEVTGTAGTDFDGQELKKLACSAYDEGTALLITSNVYPLAEIMGPAAADRFAVVQITAPSRRNDA